MSWVLGEQSAKSLRGAQMQGVIFAGTPDRRPLAMAEVTLTLVDPQVYEEPLPVTWDSADESSKFVDWDEDEVRRLRTAEAENIAASPTRYQLALQQGETIITRRPFRAGESEYLINGKPCRLRDLQGIFLSTGLGPDTYAVIGQEQIGQLLSSKPNDRWAVIEEAAGVGELKTQRRIVEKRMNGAKDSLARVDDILDEVSKQVISLRRQAAKAGRLGVARDDLHRHLRIVMASRIALIDAELGQLESEIARLNAETKEASARIEATEAQRYAVAQQGYKLERAAQEAQSMASAAELELERVTAKQRDNAERLRELEERQREAARELEQTRTEQTDALKEREQLEAASASTSEAFRSLQEKAMARQQGVRRTRGALFAMEQQVQAHRRQAAQLMTRTGEVRSKTSRTRESLTMLEQEANRLASEVREGQEALVSPTFEAFFQCSPLVKRRYCCLGSPTKAQQKRTDERSVGLCA
jgi:chromosome segregation protein